MLGIKWRGECVCLTTSKQDGAMNAGSIAETMGIIVR
jgi:hypothetical protein